MKKTFDKHKLMEALVKRAEGFFYSEEVSEFQINDEQSEKKQERIIEEKPNQKFIEIEGEEGVAKIKNKKTSKKSGSKNQFDENTELYLGQNMTCVDEASGVVNENSKNLMLVKKKVTTHYIPPDLSAIKILLEDFGQEIKGESNMLDDMSDDELLKMRSEIINNLKND